MEKVYELRTTVILKEDIELNDTYEKLGTLINYSMGKDSDLSKLHEVHKKFKHYCFSSLYPTEKDRVYKSDNYYTFSLRSSKVFLINKFKKVLTGLENNDFIIIDSELREYNKSKIKCIESITPVVITVCDKENSRSWNILKDDKEIFYETIGNNLIKKFNDIEKMNISLNYKDFINSIAIKNNIATIVNYKGIKLLGYKVLIDFKENIIAQELANICLTDGIGGKNSSCGQGFCIPHFK